MGAANSPQNNDACSCTQTNHDIVSLSLAMRAPLSNELNKRRSGGVYPGFFLNCPIDTFVCLAPGEIHLALPLGIFEREGLLTMDLKTSTVATECNPDHWSGKHSVWAEFAVVGNIRNQERFQQE